MADSLKLSIDLKGLGERIAEKLDVFANPEYLLRPIALDLIAKMTERIHDQGKASDGGQIGTYSKGYMAVRTGSYLNAKKTKTGKLKDAGVDKKGATRPKYNRTADTKVVVSLTRQLENDWSVIAIDNGYGIGFKNQHNRDKSKWVEATYKKDIFSLTEDERKYAETRFKELIQGAAQ